MPTYNVLVTQTKKTFKIIQIIADDRKAALITAKSQAMFKENFDNVGIYSAEYNAEHAQEI
jgi:predicted nucleic acid-binding Zn ribbon protein